MSQAIIENKSGFVSAAMRDSFESLKVAANPSNTQYYLGTDFENGPYNLLPGEMVDISYNTRLEVDGPNPCIIYQGVKTPKYSIKTYQTSDSASVLLVGDNAEPIVGEVLYIGVNYVDSTNPNILSSEWGNIRLYNYASSENLQELVDVNIDTSLVALVKGHTYKVKCLGYDDQDYLKFRVLPGNPEYRGFLELLDFDNLTGAQKLAVYKYLANINESGRRVPNSMGIDYVIIKEQPLDEDVLYKIAIKFIDIRFKSLIYEAREHDGNTFFTGDPVEVDPNDVNSLKKEVEALSGTVGNNTQGIANLGASLQATNDSLTDLSNEVHEDFTEVVEVPFLSDLPSVLTDQDHRIFRVLYDNVHLEEVIDGAWVLGEDEDNDGILGSSSIVSYLKAPTKIFNSTTDTIIWAKFTLPANSELFRIGISVNKYNDTDVRVDGPYFPSDWDIPTPAQPSMSPPLNEGESCSSWKTPRYGREIYVYYKVSRFSDVSDLQYTTIWIDSLSRKEQFYRYVPTVEQDSENIPLGELQHGSYYDWCYSRVPNHRDRAAKYIPDTGQFEDILSDNEEEIEAYFDENLDNVSKLIRYLPYPTLSKPLEDTYKDPQATCDQLALRISNLEKKPLNNLYEVEVGYDNDPNIKPYTKYKVGGHHNEENITSTILDKVYGYYGELNDPENPGPDDVYDYSILEANNVNAQTLVLNLDGVTRNSVINDAATPSQVSPLLDYIVILKFANNYDFSQVVDSRLDPSEYGTFIGLTRTLPSSDYEVVRPVMDTTNKTATFNLGGGPCALLILIRDDMYIMDSSIDDLIASNFMVAVDNYTYDYPTLLYRCNPSLTIFGRKITQEGIYEFTPNELGNIGDGVVSIYSVNNKAFDGEDIYIDEALINNDHPLKLGIFFSPSLDPVTNKQGVSLWVFNGDYHNDDRSNRWYPVYWVSKIEGSNDLLEFGVDPTSFKIKDSLLYYDSASSVKPDGTLHTLYTDYEDQKISLIPESIIQDLISRVTALENNQNS